MLQGQPVLHHSFEDHVPVRTDNRSPILQTMPVTPDQLQHRVPDVIKAKFPRNAEEMIEHERAFYQLKSEVPEKEYHCLLTFNPPPTKVQDMRDQWTKGLYSTLDSVSNELTARRSSKATVAV